jgi:lipopolysaccharide heptosyltransferase II
MAKNILVIKLSAIGDVLMAIPSFEAIKKKYPQAQISLLIGNWSKDAVKNNPYIDELIAIDENIFWEKRLFKLTGLFFLLKKKKFDIVYVMHWSNLFNFFVFLLGVKERIGFDRLGKGRFLTKKTPFFEGDTTYTVYKYLSLVDDNIRQYTGKINLYLTSEETRSADNMLSDYGLNVQGYIIGIAPGGGVNPKTKMPIKRWPAKYFSQTAKKIISELHVPVILFGSDKDMDICSSIEKNSGQNTLLVNLCGKTDLRQTAALLKKCQIVISNDSGLMHLAIAGGSRTISLFGPTPPWDKLPADDKHVYFYKNLPCSPCYKDGKFPDCQAISCLEAITPEEVFQKVKELLKL